MCVSAFQKARAQKSARAKNPARLKTLIFLVRECSSKKRAPEKVRAGHAYVLAWFWSIMVSEFGMNSQLFGMTAAGVPRPRKDGCSELLTTQSSPPPTPTFCPAFVRAGVNIHVASQEREQCCYYIEVGG